MEWSNYHDDKKAWSGVNIMMIRSHYKYSEDPADKKAWSGVKILLIRKHGGE